MITGEDMLIDEVDSQDHPVGVIARRDIFARHANFRVAHLLLFNRDGDLLLQQLAFSRDRSPGAWGSSVAAYVANGETYAQAANRRLPEELGVSATLQEVGKTVMQDNGSTKFITVYSGAAEGPFRIDPGHIAQVEFRSLPDIQTLRTSGGRLFTPTFLHVLDYYLGPR